MNLFGRKSHNNQSKIDNETNKIIEQFMKQKDSRENKIDTLQTTTDIHAFYDTLKTTKDVDKVSLEKELINRCFKEIDFTKEENLKELYIKLKLYKNEMSEEALKYATKLFKYCTENYVNKK